MGLLQDPHPYLRLSLSVDKEGNEKREERIRGSYAKPQKKKEKRTYFPYIKTDSLGLSTRASLTHLREGRVPYPLIEKENESTLLNEGRIFFFGIAKSEKGACTMQTRILDNAENCIR